LKNNLHSNYKQLTEKQTGEIKMMQEFLDYLDFKEEVEANSYWYYQQDGNWNEEETRFVNVFSREQE
tara:strand:+ start:3741 stop:3941 length:201 start_codon:yes stop_codon:yes gene_type:complete